nr:2-dehydro-3-deoxygalactonokinase [uncultured Caproiciproducens sp.]
MDKYIITIDTGTTNTRVSLWDNQCNYIDTVKESVGVRDTAIDGNNNRLKSVLKGCIEKLTAEHGMAEKDILAILASGMITSNVGLIEIPHVVAPVDLAMLAAAAQKIVMEEISSVPIWFIPGIKNFGTPVTLDNFEMMDIMRGEEVESIAIIEKYYDGKSMLLVLPGSHTKFVSVNEKKQITGCLTSITGELLSAITYHTIIADAVGKNFINDETAYDREMTLQGYCTAQKCGMGRAAFSGRILNQFVIDDKNKIANFIVGAVVQNDILAIMNSSALHVSENTAVVIVGKYPFGPAIFDILKYDGYFKKVVCEVPEQVKPLSALGAFIVARERKII